MLIKGGLRTRQPALAGLARAGRSWLQPASEQLPQGNTCRGLGLGGMALLWQCSSIHRPEARPHRACPQARGQTQVPTQPKDGHLWRTEEATVWERHAMLNPHTGSSWFCAPEGLLRPGGDREGSYMAHQHPSPTWRRVVAIPSLAVGAGRAQVGDVGNCSSIWGWGWESSSSSLFCSSCCLWWPDVGEHRAVITREPHRLTPAPGPR